MLPRVQRRRAAASATRGIRSLDFPLGGAGFRGGNAPCISIMHAPAPRCARNRCSASRHRQAPHFPTLCANLTHTSRSCAQTSSTAPARPCPTPSPAHTPGMNLRESHLASANQPHAQDLKAPSPQAPHPAPSAPEASNADPTPGGAPKAASEPAPGTAPLFDLDTTNKLFHAYLESDLSLPTIADDLNLPLAQVLAWCKHPHTTALLAALDEEANTRAEHRRIQSKPVAMQALSILAMSHSIKPETARKAAARILTEPRPKAPESPAPHAPPRTEPAPPPDHEPARPPTRERRAYQPIVAVTGVAGTHFPLRPVEIESLATSDIDTCARWPPGHPWPGVLTGV